MRLRIPRQHVPVLATALVWILLVALASVRHRAFFSVDVLLNLLQDNAFLGIAAVGMTFVILSGGIDLSVGAMIGLASILVATFVSQRGISPLVVLPAVVVLGGLFGAGMGGCAHFFRLPPFLVTLAGMFLLRGLALVTSLESIRIEHVLYERAMLFSLDFFPVTSLIFLLVLAAGLFVQRWTPFGRNVYAVGGSETSSLLMGLPVGAVRVGVYALSGLCAALAGIVYTFYTGAGDANAGNLLELDAIAVVVIGGTLLTGGVGSLLGTLLGVLIYGTIQTAITFEPGLSSWWTRIVIGVLLLAFILLQKLVQSRTNVQSGG